MALLVTRHELARRLEVPVDRVRPAIYLLLLAATLNFALVVSVVAAQSLFLTEVGAERLAVFYLLLAASSLPVAGLVSSLLGRRSNLVLLTCTILLAAVASLGLKLLVAASPGIGGYGALLVYTLVTMQSLALFWAMLTDYFTSLELKRFIVFVTMASALGGLTGGISLRWILRFLTTQEVLLAVVAVFGLILVLLLRLARFGGALAAGGAGKPQEGPFGGWTSLRKLARRYPMASLLAASGLLMTVTTNIFQVQVFAIFAREHPTANALTAFLGMLNAGLKALELAVAYTLTRPLIRRLGVGLANQVYPLTCLAAFVALGALPALGTALVATFVYRTLATSLAGPVLALDYNAMPQRWVGRLRVFISGVVTPVGLAFSGLLLLLVQRWMSATAVAGLGAAVSAVLLVLGYSTGRAYFRSLLSMLRARTVNFEEVAEGLSRLPASEAGPVRELLSSDDPLHQRLGLGLVERMDASLFETELAALVERVDQPTARVLVSFYSRQKKEFFARRGPLLLESANEAVRAATLEQLLTTGSRRYLENAGRRLGRELVGDPSPEVRTVARAASYQLARGTESQTLPSVAGEAVRGRMKEILDRDGRSPRMLLIDGVLTSAPLDVRARALEVLSNMTAVGDVAMVELSRVQAEHADPRIRRAAIGLLAAACGDDQLGELARGLDDAEREVRDAAVAAFATRAGAGADDATIEAARPCLDSMRPETVSSAVAAIGAAGTPAAEQALVDHLRQDLDRAGVVCSWLREVPDGDVFWEPLRVAAEDAAERIRRRSFEALSALGEESTIDRVRHLLASPNPRVHANAIETFGSVGRRRLTQPVQELLEARLAPADGAGWSAADLPAVLERAAGDRDPWIRRAAEMVATREGTALPEPERPPLATAAVPLKLEPSDTATESEVSMSRLLFLTKVPIFQQFTLDELSVVDAALEPMEFFTGEEVFTEGEPGDRFYLVERGRVIFFKQSLDEKLEVGRVGAGDYFGEMSLFDDSPRSATVEAAEDSLLLALDRDRLHSLVAQKPEIAWAFCRELSTRLRESNERWRKVNVRLAQQKS